MSTITEIKNIIKFYEQEMIRYRSIIDQHKQNSDYTYNYKYYQGQHDACQGFINLLNNFLNKGK